MSYFRLKRGEIGLSRRHRKRPLNQLGQQLKQNDDNESDEGGKTDENTINNRVCQQGVESRMKEHLNEKNLEVEATDEVDGGPFEVGKSDQSSTKSMKNKARTSNKSPPFKKETIESFMIGNAQVSLVDSPCVRIDCSEEKQEDSVTVISVKQMNDIEREKSRSQSSEEQFSDNQSNSEDEILGNQSDVPSNSSNEMLALPSASFLTTAAKRRSSAIDMKMLKNYLKSCDSDIDSDSVKNSPKFGKNQPGKKTIEVVSSCSSSEETRREDKINASNIKDLDLKPISGNYKTVPKHKLKRKFPNFSSDSDSDTNITVKKAKTNNFVSLENMKSNSKKMAISKSFFSQDGGKAQPTLSFFMSDKKGRPQNKNPAVKKKSSSCIDEDTEEDDVVIEHIEFPKVKNELDVDLMKEIQTIRCVFMFFI